MTEKRITTFWIDGEAHTSDDCWCTSVGRNPATHLSRVAQEGGVMKPTYCWCPACDDAILRDQDYGLAHRSICSSVDDKTVTMIRMRPGAAQAQMRGWSE